MLQTVGEQAQGKPGTSSGAQHWVGRIGLAIGVGIAYFLAARLGRALLTTTEGISVFWLGSGIAAGILIALGGGVRAAVVTGVVGASLAINLIGGTSIWSALAFGVCNAGEAVLVAWLVERLSGPAFTLDSLRGVAVLFVAAGAAASVAAAGAATAMTLLGPSSAPWSNIWRVWFAADALGIVTVAPLVIGLVASMRDVPSWREFLEGTLAVVALAAVYASALALLAGPWLLIAPATVLFPLLFWLGARCRPAFVAAAAFAIAAAIVWTTTHEFGRFGDSSQPAAARIIAAQVTMLGTTLAALALAALFAERRRNEAALVDALAAGAVMAFEWDPRTGLSQRSKNAAEILGFSPELAPSDPGNRFLARVHPDDRARFITHVRGVGRIQPSYAVSFRFLRPDGREVWLEETARAAFDASGRIASIRGLTRDVTKAKRAEERQRMLVAELDHRVKNVLARVSAVAKFTRNGTASMDELVGALDGRIQSMANAHALLSRSGWEGVSLADLVNQELAPYATTQNTTVDGPEVTLSAEATEALGMVLHELVTNAAKYGSLSTPHGLVVVSWHRSPDDGSPSNLTIDWCESGGPPAAVPVRRGHGADLISNLIPYELGGTVDLNFAGNGLRCRMEIPLEAPRAGSAATASPVR